MIFGPNLSEIGALKAEVAKTVEITDLGDISFFLGIQIQRNRVERAIYINQTRFIEELINRFDYKDLKLYRTPTELGIRLDKNDLAADPTEIENFQRQIGSLMYLIISTQPDLSYAVGLCVRFMSNPRANHFRALNRIWRYILHTVNLNIVFGPCQNIGLEGYCDAD